MTTTLISDTNGIMPRAWRFLKKPWSEKRKFFYFRWVKAFPNAPAPLRLPFGAWWLVRNDHVSEPILDGKFELSEFSFVKRFLKLGMTVLDIGAHHGLYTLLASKCVGRDGRVIAFEPSPRERKALRLHLKLNRCKNVDVQEFALGDKQTTAYLHVVDDWAAGCNSLRPPDVAANTTPVPVIIVRLDDWLADNKIKYVDFIKLDVEGAELATLKGAGWLLERRPRPVILAELQDIRTRGWGYLAKDVALLAESFGFRWFALQLDGRLSCLPEETKTYEGNFVAIPRERLRHFTETADYETGI
jgi:FkbM family methyltransferase